jgi:hypothetical protein
MTRARFAPGAAGRLLATCALVATGAARADETRPYELSGGVGAGGIMAGSKPRLAVTPHIAFLWRSQAGFLVAAQEMFSITPAVNQFGVGVFSQTSIDLGFAWSSGNVSLGPLVAGYSLLACNDQVNGCRRVTGVGPGAHLQAAFYFAGALGVSTWASVEWLGGSSAILPGGLAGTLFAGPVLRWRVK